MRGEKKKKLSYLSRFSSSSSIHIQSRGQQSIFNIRDYFDSNKRTKTNIYFLSDGIETCSFIKRSCTYR